MRALVLALALTVAGCGSSLTANQKLVVATEASLQGAAAALGAYDLAHQHAVLAAVIAKHGTLADFTAQITAYRKARGEAVDALKYALAAAKDAEAKPSEATLGVLAIDLTNLYNKLSALGLVLKPPAAALPPPTSRLDPLDALAVAMAATGDAVVNPTMRVAVVEGY